MSKPNWMEKAGVTPRQLMLVAILAVVLVVVIVGQLPSSSATPPRANSDSSLPPTQSINALHEPQTDSEGGTSLSSNSSASEQPTRTWPKLPMNSSLSYDPLTAPDWFVTEHDAAPLVVDVEGQEQKEQALQKLLEQEAQAIVFSGNEKRASIGNQSVRIGDMINGFRITDITREGIVLTE